MFIGLAKKPLYVFHSVHFLGECMAGIRTQIRSKNYHTDYEKQELLTFCAGRVLICQINAAY